MSGRRDHQRLAAALLLAAAPMLVLWLWSAGPLAHGSGPASDAWHPLLDLATMLIGAAIVSVAWNARELEAARGVPVLGAACAGAVLLEIAHTLGPAGLVRIAGAASANDAEFLSLAARLLIALALFGLAAVPAGQDHGPRWQRRAAAAVAAYLFGVTVWLLAWPGSLPGLTTATGAPTPAQRIVEAVLVGLFAAAAALFARRRAAAPSPDAVPMLSAAALMALGELVFMLAGRMTELTMIVGHAYKLLGFWMLYRTLVRDSIRLPYRRLLESRRLLHASEDELRTITDNIPALVAFFDTEQRYRFVNLNYQRWLGLDPAAMLGRSVREVIGEESYTSLRPHIERALAGQSFSIDHRITGFEHARGRWLNIVYMPKLGDDGEVSGVYVLSSDITDVMIAERRALFLAEHDELTTLPNRAAFQAAVGRALEHSAVEPSQFAVVFVDVDRFKVVNDTLGHAAGDQLLQELATRMKHIVRDRDLVARMGGDEMCVLLHDVHDAAHASEIAERILAALRVPVELRTGIQHHVTASAGIAVFPHDGADVETLLRHADIAMYRAKAAGRDGYALFGAHDGGPVEARLNLELELRTAIDAGQLVLHYQPRVNVASGRPVGVEALVRWQHPERGLLAPDHFIDIAEETGLIVPMGAWVLRQAGQALRRLHDAGANGLTMSVNVSARQFKNPNLVAEVTEMIELAGCAPCQVELELTESAVMEQPETAEATMCRLKALGVRLAMDDFGTGYSSLAALKRFPVDCVKIDRSFVNDIPGDCDDAALTRAIIAMGHSLGLHVVAEGVERRDQLEFLRREGCDEYQGYHFARPMAEAALCALLKQLSQRPALVAVN